MKRAAFLLLIVLTADRGLAAEAIRYDREIRPILSRNCFVCHGPDEGSREAGLRLDRFESATADRDGSRAISPGDPGASELIHRITSGDPEFVMPPADSNRSLTAGEIELLRRWIEQGATYEEHWSFAPVQRPQAESIDEIVRARLEREGLAMSPVADRATLIRRLSLDLTGLPPTPEQTAAFVADEDAGAYERVVDSLLASPSYGEHMARTWLDIARYGDTHGLHLDNYREMWPYRDWVIDAFNRNMPYDRFLVEQLAGDLLEHPTREQRIATGYLRCNVTTNEGGSIVEEVLARNVFDRVDSFATGLMGASLACARCHDHKYDPFTQTDYYSLFAFFNSLDGKAMDDNAPAPVPIVRVPSPEQEVQLAALDEEVARIEEAMLGPLPELDAAQAEWERAEAARLLSCWSATELVTATSPTPETTLTPQPDGSVLASGASPDREAYEIVVATDLVGITAIRLEAMADPSTPGGGAGRAANDNFVLTDFSVLAAPREDPAAETEVPLASAVADWSQGGFEIEKAIDEDPASGWAVAGNLFKETRTAIFAPAAPIAGSPGGTLLRVRLRFDYGTAHAIGRLRLTVSDRPDAAGASLGVELGTWHTLGPFEPGDSKKAFAIDFGPETGVDLANVYEGVKGEIRWTERPEFVDGRVHALTGTTSATYVTRNVRAVHPCRVTLSLGSDDDIKVFANGELAFAKEVGRPAAPDQDRVAIDLAAGDNQLLLKIVNGGGPTSFYFRLAGEDFLRLPADVAGILMAAGTERSATDDRRLRSHYRSVHWDEWSALEAEIASMQDGRRQLEAKIPSTLVFSERAEPRPAFVLERGEYDRPGAPVERRTPAALPPMAPELPRNRLGLARWLVDPAHPLTARVAVNRLWQLVFGAGLVPTSEELGAQGEAPSHPELLDWLAAEFVASGWDVKGLLRRLVCSETYAQSSVVTPALLQRDPANRLLARAPRYRLDAEVLRDQALAASGLLVRQLGGPSVKPPQPAGVWKAVAYVGSNTMSFTADMGPDKVHRRSLYTFWKRTAPPPQMSILDAPSRESCIVRRERTNTPLQALMLLNDRQYLEAARHLATRVLREADGGPEDRASRLYELVACRPPAALDVADLVAFQQECLATFRGDPDAAAEFIQVGEEPPPEEFDAAELASWQAAASAVLNLDIVLTRD